MSRPDHPAGPCRSALHDGTPPNAGLRFLFVVAVKHRLIDNTPSDVYRVASQFAAGDVEVVDVRLPLPPAGLPDSDTAVLFLETAGTWMCFEWDPDRFTALVDRLLGRCRRLVVVGPQATALKTLSGRPFEVVDTLDFIDALAPRPPGDARPGIAPIWLEPGRHPGYNGESFDGRRMRLVPTFSISHSMNCPMRCEFCFYGRGPRSTRPPFESLMADVERAWSHGHRHFYLMDPNFLPSPSDVESLQDFHRRTGGRFSYFCQVSPNALSDSRIRQLASSGCQGVVIGIENADRIADKGNVAEARERVDAVRAAGMMPMLFFMLDERHDAEALVQSFDPIPFRYTVFNAAFAGDRSLRSIESGFAAKNRLLARHRELILRLQRRPAYLGYTPAGPADIEASRSAPACR